MWITLFGGGERENITLPMNWELLASTVCFAKPQGPKVISAFCERYWFCYTNCSSRSIIIPLDQQQGSSSSNNICLASPPFPPVHV